MTYLRWKGALAESFKECNVRLGQLLTLLCFPFLYGIEDEVKAKCHFPVPLNMHISHHGIMFLSYRYCHS